MLTKELCPSQRKSCGALMWDFRVGLALRDLRGGLGSRGMSSSLVRWLLIQVILVVVPKLSPSFGFLISSKITTYVTCFLMIK